VERSRPGRPGLGIVEFLVWPLIGLGVLVVAEVYAQRAGAVIPEPLSGSIFYALWGVWVVHRARAEPVGLDLRALAAPPRRPREWWYLLLVVPLVVVSVAALYLVIAGASLVAPGAVRHWLDAAGADSAMGAPTALAFTGMMAENALGAVAEELVFRGVLLHLWAARFGVRLGVLATSLLFAVMHADVLGSLIFGVAMAVLYMRTGTLLVPIALHFLFNVCVDVVGILDRDPRQALSLAELRADWWQAGMAFVAALAVIVVVLRRALSAPSPPARPTAPGSRARGR
jgi:membrane protease YdiL (CAAX protease family)